MLHNDALLAAAPHHQNDGNNGNPDHNAHDHAIPEGSSAALLHWFFGRRAVGLQQAWVHICHAFLSSCVYAWVVVSFGSVGESGGRADSIEQGLAVVLLERAKSATASRLTVGTLQTNEAVTQSITMRSARKDVRVFGQARGVKHFLKLLHSVLDVIHIPNGRLNWGQALRHGRSEGWFENAGTEFVVGERQAPPQ